MSDNVYIFRQQLKEKDKEHRFGVIYNLICMYYSTNKAQDFVKRIFLWM